jgi:DNA polymerase III subunit delta
MSKTYNKHPFISEAVKNLIKNDPLPIYYFYGEDTFLIQEAVKKIEEKIKPYLASEFDKEVLYGSNVKLIDVLNIASSFPFSSQKKLIILKEFEKIKDKKVLTGYIKSPADFTVLILIHEGEVRDASSELYKNLSSKNFIYSAKELKGKYLITWIIDNCAENGKNISEENAQTIIDLIGENKSLIDGQLEKIFTYLGDRNIIEIEDILKVSSELREYNIFDLEDALGKKDKENSFKIAYNLLEQGKGQVYIISMLTRYFTIVTRIRELISKKASPREAGISLGFSERLYYKYMNAAKIYSESELFRISQAIHESDLLSKSTSIEEKTLISILLATILTPKD